MDLASKFSFTTLAILSITLSACSSFIPPQTVADPIGVAGQKVQVVIGAPGVLQTTAAGTGVIKTTFSDLDTGALPFELNLSQSLFKVAFAAETQLETTANLLPCGIILTNVAIDISINDAANNYALPTFKVNKIVELEQQKNNPKTYRIVTEDAFVGIALSQAEARRLQDIISTGGDNEAIIQVTVQATSVPDLATGSLLTFTFETSEATVTF